MHIMLTGHCGYIGSALCKKLNTHSIVGFDLLEGHNLLDIPLKEKFDLIIHLAGKSGVRKSIDNPADYWHHNVEVTKRLLSIYGNKTRFLYASSSSAYEPDLNPYAASKLCVEAAASRYDNTLGMRFHTVYNQNPRHGMFVQKLLDKQLEYTTNHYRDFIHMDDLCDAIIKCINSTITGIIDIGTGTPIAVRDLAPHLPVRLNTVGEREITCANTKNLRKLNFTPKHNIIDFLKNLQ